MDLLNSAFMNGLAGRMRFLAARTGLIAQNIANANTPNFEAQDLAPPDSATRDFAQLTRSAARKAQNSQQAGALRVSDPRHMQATSARAGEFRAVDAPDAEAGLNGNKVSVETQMMKLSETRMAYQMASSVYRKGVDMMRLAARGTR